MGSGFVHTGRSSSAGAPQAQQAQWTQLTSQLRYAGSSQNRFVSLLTGFKLFPEIEVPTKGFGAFARRFGCPTFITPRELDRALHFDEDWIVLDSRPPAEYRKGNIPGSIDALGADVVRCFDDLAPRASTKAVPCRTTI